MSLKKSEEFFYFQNKASHYHNIRTAKSKLDNTPPQSFSQTIDYHQIKPNNHQPSLR